MSETEFVRWREFITAVTGLTIPENAELTDRDLLFLVACVGAAEEMRWVNALTKFYIEGLGFREAGHELGYSHAAVHSWATQGIAHMRKSPSLYGQMVAVGRRIIEATPPLPPEPDPEPPRPCEVRVFMTEEVFDGLTTYAAQEHLTRSKAAFVLIEQALSNG